jgi:VanZ family protein
MRGYGLEKLKVFLWRWGPAVALMAVIFVASSQPKVSVPQFGSYDWPVKKLAHVMTYGLLGIAYLHGLAGGRSPTLSLVVAAALMAAAYGATDEFHQRFVPGRGAVVTDVWIDTMGAMGGLALQWILGRVTRIPARPTPPRSTP